MPQQKQQHWAGKDGFVWWAGVVEARDDPLKLGRCRVRIVGFHSENKVMIPTSDLPWAYPLQSVTSAAMNGIGTTPLGPVEGTWVVGFFRDGAEAQDPVMLGTLGGIPQALSNPTVGFGDPNAVYPLATHLLEADTNRLAKNDVDRPHAVLATKTADLDLAVSTAGGSAWNEPVPPYNAEYPKNHVRESESGHIEEWDDTPGSERLHRRHTSGTFEEIHPDGTRVVKVKGDNYEITAGDDYVHIEGTCNVTVDGNCNLKASTVNVEATTLSLKSTANTDIEAGGILTLKGTIIDLNP